MKRIYLGLCLAAMTLLSPMASAEVFDREHTVFDQVLKAYVSDGLVNYAQLAEDSHIDGSPLNSYLAEIARLPQENFDKWPLDDQLALLINLYNASTLQVIAANYPVDSIREIGWWGHTAWKQKNIRLFGRKISLDMLEHDIIRGQFQEPGIHFALVCAAMGCPPLRNEVYLGKTLIAQLADQSRIFLGNPAKNRFDAKGGKVYLSDIFRWYSEDFGKDQAEILGTLLQYWPEEIQAQFRGHNFAGLDMNYTHYDWSLNETPDSSLRRKAAE